MIICSGNACAADSATQSPHESAVPAPDSVNWETCGTVVWLPLAHTPKVSRIDSSCESDVAQCDRVRTAIQARQAR